MKFYKIVLALIVCFQIKCMEQPPQPQKYNLASFSGLPADIKEYLLPFIVSGTLKDMTRGLYNLAALDKKHHAWINDPQRIIRTLDGLPRICSGIRVIERLLNKTNSLPVMQDLGIVNWQNEAKKVPLKNGNALTNAMIKDDKSESTRLLNSKDIDLSGVLLREVFVSNIERVESLLSAGANPDTRNCDNRTGIMIAIEKQNIPIIHLFISEGANTMLHCNFGFTALGHALSKYKIDFKFVKDKVDKDLEIIMLLLKSGARLNFSATDNVLYDDFVKEGHAKIIALLDQYGIKK